MCRGGECGTIIAVMGVRWENTQCREFYSVHTLPSGTETPGVASPECIVCPKGTKSEYNDEGYQVCVNCKINEYQSSEGSTVCEECRCGKVSAIRSPNCKEPVSRDQLAQINPPTSVTQFAPRAIRVEFDTLKTINNGRLLYYQLEWTSIIRVPDFSTT